MSSAPAPRPPRGPSAHLAAARAADSKAKTERVLDTVAALLRSGSRVTFVNVARHARVSTWLLYNKPQLTAAVRAAMDDQNTNGIVAAHPGTSQVSAHSVATDLAIARHEVRDLRTERDKLKKRLQLSLGAELDEVTQEELVTRIRELEQDNATLRAGAAELTSRVALSTRRADELENDLAAARLSLRRMVKQGAECPPPRS